jgi:hypothetical protein
MKDTDLVRVLAKKYLDKRAQCKTWVRAQLSERGHGHGNFFPAMPETSAQKNPGFFEN